MSIHQKDNGGGWWFILTGFIESATRSNSRAVVGALTDHLESAAQHVAFNGLAA